VASLEHVDAVLGVDHLELHDTREELSEAELAVTAPKVIGETRVVVEWQQRAAGERLASGQSTAILPHADREHGLAAGGHVAGRIVEKHRVGRAGAFVTVATDLGGGCEVIVAIVLVAALEHLLVRDDENEPKLN